MNTPRTIISTLALAAMFTGCATFGPLQMAEEERKPSGAMGQELQNRPTSVEDYRWYFKDRLATLPPARLAELPALVRALDQYRSRAEENFGRWVDGDTILGAKPKEYQPSDDELMESVIGGRICAIVAGTPAAQVDWILRDAGIDGRSLVYRAISFRTIRISGVGAFHYASTPIRTTLTLVADDQIAAR